jgi:hypothetical protein
VLGPVGLATPLQQLQALRTYILEQAVTEARYQLLQ